MEIRLSIKDKYVDAFMILIKKLKYVEIKEVIDNKEVESKADAWKRVAQDDEMLSLANEGLTDYKLLINKKNRPSADEIEQLIIAKALRDAKAIERGELKGMKSYANYKDLIADLESDIENDDDIYTNQ